VTTSKDGLPKTPAYDWQADWKDNEQAELRSWLRATPAQRLAWLEDAMKLAYQAGALGQKKQD
jgi:hypothetical protein